MEAPSPDNLHNGPTPPSTDPPVLETDAGRPCETTPSFAGPSEPPPLPQPKSAGFWRRGTALMLDIVLLVPTGLILFGVTGAFFGGALHAAGIVISTTLAALLGAIFGLLLSWLYFACFESGRQGATPGKMVVGIHVVKDPGDRMSFARASVRYWGKAFSALLLGVGFVMAAFTTEKRGLHDLLAGCRVLHRRNTAGALPPPLAHSGGIYGSAATTGIALLIAGAAIMVQMLIMMVYIVKETLSDPAFDTDVFYETIYLQGDFLMLTAAVTLTFAAVLTVLVIAVRRGVTLSEYLALRPISWNSVWKMTGLTAAFMAASVALSALLGRDTLPEVMMDIYLTSHSPWLLMLAVLVVAPLAEEIFFRGFLLKGWRNSRLGDTGTVLLTSFLWTILHFQYQAYELFYIFALGVILGVVRLRTGSLWNCVLIHGLNNMVATLMLAYIVEIEML